MRFAVCFCASDVWPDEERRVGPCRLCQIFDWLGYARASLDEKNVRADLNILAGKLSNLGLTQAQSERLLAEVLARADMLIGADGVAKIRAILPALDQRSSPR
jgi:hypothetical protein